MDIRWLQDFLTLAETGSFTRAAQLRHVSQAAFSRRIQALETWAEKTLIDRTSFPPSLTADGEVFRARTATIVQQIADARLMGPIGGRLKQVRLALPHSLATGRLPAWWSNWSKMLGEEVAMRVLTGDVGVTAAALMTGEVDVLICYRSENLPVTLPKDQYEHLVIGRETFAPFGSPSLVSLIEGRGPTQQPSQLPLLRYTKSATFAHVYNAIMEEAEDQPKGTAAFETESASVLRTMAIAGHGVAWLPECVASSAPSGTLERIRRAGWSTDLEVVAYRDRQAVNPTLNQLWRLLSDMAPHEDNIDAPAPPQPPVLLPRSTVGGT